MVNSSQQTFEPSCNCSGFSVCFKVQSCDNDTSFFDSVPILRIDTQDEVTTISGRPAFISRTEITRLIEFLNRIVASSTCNEADTFVPLELGFELTIEDFDVDSSAPDECEGTMSIWINCGYMEGIGRSYAGAKGIVTAKELVRFSRAWQRLVEDHNA